MKHFAYAIPCGFVGTELFVLGLAIGMEFKDKTYGGQFDWLDIAATFIGRHRRAAASSGLNHGIV